MFGGNLVSLLISTLVTIQDIRRCSGTEELPVQHGVNFIGIGYNIIEGNPEGGDLSTGGVDPGLLISRRIFGFSFDDGKTTSDLKNRIPDEVTLVLRNSEFTTSTLSTFYGTESYASKLSAQVEVSGGYESVTTSVKFAASARYERVADKTSSEGSVFLSKETITNLGHARYQTELAHTGERLLVTGFVADACQLPATFTEETKRDYMEFMDDWGTHVVTEVALGKREGENFEEERSSFVNYVAQNVEGSISGGGSFGGFSASLSVNMESFTSAMDSGTSFGKTYSKYRIGSETRNEPISVRLMAMPAIFEPEFWTGLDDYIAAGHCTESFDLTIVKENLDNALRGYGDWLQIEKSSNPDIRIPLTWPGGVYGLPEPFDGCPVADWNVGHRIHVTGFGSNDGEIQISSSASDHDIFAGWVKGVLSRQDFCMKTVSTVPGGSQWQWQPGSYCIFQYGPQCPEGFTSGHIHWTEENEYPDFSINVGVVPEGTYGTDTEINFCCRNDGVTSRPIYLPTNNNFMLLARHEQCQLVHDMSVKKEWIYWDTAGTSQQSKVHPGDGVYSGGVRLLYCYYHAGDIVYDPDAETKREELIRGDVEFLITTLCKNHPKECPMGWTGRLPIP